MWYTPAFPHHTLRGSKVLQQHKALNMEVPMPSPFMQSLSRDMRLRGYALRTEKTRLVPVTSTAGYPARFPAAKPVVPPGPSVAARPSP